MLPIKALGRKDYPMSDDKRPRTDVERVEEAC